MKKRIFGMLLMGAMVIASMSMFTSCKDYDDDINKNASDIAALKTELASLRTTLSGDLTSAKSELSALIANKADVKDLTAAVSRIAALETQIKALDNAATKDDVEALKVSLGALTGELEKYALSTDLEAVKKAAEENVKTQTEALEALKKDLETLKATAGDKTAVEAIQKSIDDMKKQLSAFAAKSDFDALKTDMQKLSDDLTKKVNDNINVLSVLVSKRLTSLDVIPTFYWEGLEGVEVPYIYKTQIFVNNASDVTFKFQNITYKVKENDMAWLQTDGTKVKVLDKVAANEGLADVQALVDNDGYNNLTQKYLYRELYPNPVANTASFVTKGSTTGKDKTINISNGGVATYHLNPSKANLENATYAFSSNFAEVYTRAAGDFATPVSDKVKAENGILTVPFDVDIDVLEKCYADFLASRAQNTNKYTWQNSWGWTDADGVWHYNTSTYNDPASMTDDDDVSRKYSYNGKLPFVSLQIGLPADEANKIEAATVNSDYTVVTPAHLANLALADNGAENLTGNTGQNAWGSFDGKCYSQTAWTHLWRTSPSAITGIATHSVVYNEQIDLKPFIETHFDYISLAKYGESYADKKMDATLFAALGLKYKYTIVNYLVGDNTTGESEHIAQVSDGVFEPRSVKESSNPNMSGGQKEAARRETVGREPLIRVDLLDANDNILTYGYIKLRIVDSKPTTYFAEINLADLYMNCGAEGKVTWSQMEDLILYQLNGGNGLLKKEFEQQYYMEVAGGYTQMHQGAANTIYTDGWQAIRYDATDAQWAAKDASKFKKLTDATKYYGNVWYTPNDNATNHYDQLTNVIVWNMDDADATAGNNMNAAKFKDMMTKLAVTIANEGRNANALSTIIRFKKKDEGDANSLYVRLYFNPNQIHFQYASVANKDLHHWYVFNTTTPGTQTDIDTRANVPTPAETNFAVLDNTSFNKDLLEFWQNSADIVKLAGGKDKFGKFYNADGSQKITPELYFTLPVENVNSTISYTTLATAITTTGNTGAATSYTKVWNVKGISGSTWTLALDKSSRTNKANQAIVAIQQNGKTLNPVQTIVEFYAPSKVHYYGDQKKDNGSASQTVTNDAATDLLNRVGRLKNDGTDQTDYLNYNIDYTFTSYVEIVLTDNPCYQPLIKDNLFNVKFLRPINVWGNKIAWTDALNQIENVNISDLVNIVDWRNYPVIAKDSKSGLPYHNASATDKGQYNKAIAYQEGLTPYEFYGITDLAVVRDDIRSDAWEEYTVRVADPVADPSAYPTIDKISSLTSADYTQHYLKVLDGAGNEVDKNSANKFTVGSAGTDFGKITYTNNGGNAQIFHIYVPIAIKYNWGNIKFKYTDQDTSTNLDKTKNYTQTVWAVITVNKTVGQTGHSSREK